MARMAFDIELPGLWLKKEEKGLLQRKQDSNDHALGTNSFLF